MACNFVFVTTFLMNLFDSRNSDRMISVDVCSLQQRALLVRWLQNLKFRFTWPTIRSHCGSSDKLPTRCVGVVKDHFPANPRTFPHIPVKDHPALAVQTVRLISDLWRQNKLFSNLISFCSNKRIKNKYLPNNDRPKLWMNRLSGRSLWSVPTVQVPTVWNCVKCLSYANYSVLV